jgi:hypothetical protein
MVGIGIRVYSNSRIYYAIISYDKEKGELAYKSISHLNVPVTLEKPEQLNFIRNSILDLMLEYNVEMAAIRLAEMGIGTIKQTTIDRYYLEGVIQEAIASSPVRKYVAGPIAKLSASFEKRTDFKEYAGGVKDFEHLPEDINWKALTLEERESVLACFAAINLN